MPPDLHLGWLSNYSKKAAVHLNPKGLQAHTAIIAQSGSGKSFTLGRLLEEIASKTQARVLILDPNSDFAKFSEVRQEAWAELKDHFASEDTLTEFQRRWAQVGFNVLTNRDQSTLGLQQKKTEANPITISWDSLSVWDMGGYLGILGEGGYGEMTALRNIKEYGSEFRKPMEDPFTISEYQRAVDDIFVTQKGGVTDATMKGDWRARLSQQLHSFVDPGAIEQLRGRLAEFADLAVWDKKGGKDLRTQVPHPSEVGPSRVVCLDLGSLSKPEERLLAADVALRSLWEGARDSWQKAMEKEPDHDDRSPVFIVIDEAHNLGPAEPRTEQARMVNDILVRIAAEGRKYGLFLILVTQRPSRLDTSLLSQCDNLVLQKMNNRHDLDLVERVFGFIPEGYAKRAFEFKTGDALLAGTFVEGPTYAHIAPRRTQEGGRNIRKEFWTRDPVPPAPDDPVTS
jgi:hypothetical protein